MTYFYNELPYVEDFKDITSERLFKDVPSDWLVIVSDVQGSTMKIEEGNFHDVNFVASAATTAVLNIDKNVEFPFVFGGDGSTILIPPEYEENAKSVLLDTKKFSYDNFGLNLRIGIVPVIDVLRSRNKIKILKLKVTDNYFQAVFNGGGLDHAEYLVKNDPKYRVKKTKSNYKADYTGLKCVWQDIPSKKEEIVSLLVKANSALFNDVEVYKKVVKKISDLYGKKEERFPVKSKNIRIRNSRKKIYLESMIYAHQHGLNKKRLFIRNYIKAKFESIYKIFKKGFETISFSAYKNTFMHSVDSEKFDDMLRMVIAGNKDQRLELIDFLEQYYQDGQLAYGVNVAKSVHMSCLIIERKGKRVHFIDGSNGGYTNAAKELKNRIKWQKVYMKGY